MTTNPLVPRFNLRWAFLAHRLSTHLTTSVTPEDWSVPNGYVTKTGVWLDQNTFLPYPSPRHQRLWWKYRFGISDQDIRSDADRAVLLGYPPDGDDDLTQPSRYSSADYHTAPWSFISLVDFLSCVPWIPGQHWPDPHALTHPDHPDADLARTHWHPLWHRTTRRGQPGWVHPTLSGLFFPDDVRLASFNQQIDWTDGGSIGNWLATLLPTLETVYGSWPRDPWLLWGFQLLLWQTIGIGYVTWTPARTVTLHGAAR
ncbi:MAG: hypothetical protein C7B44_05705 [Sulfobacillus thermosulfidooxidans]|uniref:Uncharacterized protein n=1 Tax=Sulfobacillus acidophilus TaxID=53633 RepID=A0A2T2WCD4_9FIRM|nr:MAG: hypothetical protein C7B45_17685 [Sulfobacillus acidophilus]PSR37059.1 MAG: hypothetical protein C7B44_05705 [Sulfobacillus thermosulfidooxidans]